MDFPLFQIIFVKKAKGSDGEKEKFCFQRRWWKTDKNSRRIGLFTGAENHEDETER